MLDFICTIWKAHNYKKYLKAKALCKLLCGTQIETNGYMLNKIVNAMAIVEAYELSYKK
jgi:hypothetical protein